MLAAHAAVRPLAVALAAMSSAFTWMWNSCLCGVGCLCVYICVWGMFVCEHNNRHPAPGPPRCFCSSALVALKIDNLCSKYRLAGGATVSQKCFMHSSTETNLQLIQRAVCERINARILGHVAVISKRMILEAENLAATCALGSTTDPAAQ